MKEKRANMKNNELEIPQVLRSKTIHKGWLELRVDELQLSGTTQVYDVVKIGDGVATLPFLSDKILLLAEQYRHPVQDCLLELIQGGIKNGEPIEDAAQRELLEETGYSGKIEYTNTIYPMPASLDMRLHIMKATNLKKVQEPEFNPLERMKLIHKPYQEVLEEVLSGIHKDSALVFAILNYQTRISLDIS